MAVSHGRRLSRDVPDHPDVVRCSHWMNDVGGSWAEACGGVPTIAGIYFSLRWPHCRVHPLSWLSKVKV